jgi:DNA polymerase
MDELQVIEAEVRSCPRCRLSQTRKRAVPGEGPPNAKIMFIGEGPGYWENEEGRPFVGQAGKLLEELLASIGLRREDVYITNVVKCRPPSNRDPLPDELAACHEYLVRQIACIQPRVIVTLGRFSMAKFFPAGRGMRDLHGTTARYGPATCMAAYHPAAALRTPALKQVLIEDFKKIPALLAKAEAEFEASGPPVLPEREPEQLSLF